MMKAVPMFKVGKVLHHRGLPNERVSKQVCCITDATQYGTQARHSEAGQMLHRRGLRNKKVSKCVLHHQ